MVTFFQLHGSEHRVDPRKNASMFTYAYFQNSVQRKKDAIMLGRNCSKATQSVVSGFFVSSEIHLLHRIFFLKKSRRCAKHNAIIY